MENTHLHVHTRTHAHMLALTHIDRQTDAHRDAITPKKWDRVG